MKFLEYKVNGLNNPILCLFIAAFKSMCLEKYIIILYFIIFKGDKLAGGHRAKNLVNILTPNYLTFI